MGKYVCKWKLVIFVGGLGVLMIKGIMKINYKIVNYYIIWMNLVICIFYILLGILWDCDFLLCMYNLICGIKKLIIELYY